MEAVTVPSQARNEFTFQARTVKASCCGLGGLVKEGLERVEEVEGLLHWRNGVG
jgi:hypothetical protein